MLEESSSQGDVKGAECASFDDMVIECETDELIEESFSEGDTKGAECASSMAIEEAKIQYLVRIVIWQSQFSLPFGCTVQTEDFICVHRFSSKQIRDRHTAKHLRVIRTGQSDNAAKKIRNLELPTILYNVLFRQMTKK